MQIERIKPYDKNDIFLNIRFPEICNLKCEFCYQNVTYDKNTIEKINNKLDFLAICLKLLNKRTNRNLNVTLIGGEPTLFNLNKLFSIEYTDRIKFHITSNGTLLSKKLFSNSTKNVKIDVVLSLHETQVNVDQWFKHINQYKEYISQILIVKTLNNEKSIQEIINKYQEYKYEIILDIHNLDKLKRSTISTNNDVSTTYNYDGKIVYTEYLKGMDFFLERNVFHIMNWLLITMLYLNVIIVLKKLN